MFKKLINGELGIVATFWQFAVLGLLSLTLFTRIIGKILAHKLGKQTILSYLFSFKVEDGSTPFLIVLYLSLTSFLLFYCCSLLLGIWRSSASYDRSIWLRHLSRIITVILVFLSIKIVFWGLK
ncbi:MAG: hypothetical protein J6Y53_03035 [Alphaproteobacteria bacterium]|nr:hypothetical protein [Alphaproteobacteria bacterium]